MKINKICLLLLAVTLTLSSCGDDEKPENPVTTTDDDGGMTDDGDSTAALEMAQDAVTVSLTNGVEKVWRIASATLNNTSGTVDISTNFNVVDDEFIFSGSRTNGQIEWRPGNKIAVDGTTSEETLLDFYGDSEKSTFAFNTGSSTDLTGLDGRLTFTVIDENTINGVLSFPTRSAGETISLTLTDKRPEDYAVAPQSGLNFTEALVYNSNNVVGFAPGMIGSYSDNSLFVVNRLTNSNGSNEQVVKFDLNTGASQENLFANADFVSKELLIRDNKLVAVGGQFVNTYDLNLTGDPTSVMHGKRLTRFGSAVAGNTLYIIGGDLNNDPDTGAPLEADKIFAYDVVNNILTDFVTLPEGRFGARATVVNDKLYIFGGTQTWPPSNEVEKKNTIYIVDLATKEITTEFMTEAVDYSYVDRFQNLIFVGGRIDVFDPTDNSFVDRDHMLGVYDTNTGTYSDISYNLPDEMDGKTINSLTVFNGKLYVMFTNGVDNDDNPDTETPISIMVADLN